LAFHHVSNLLTPATSLLRPGIALCVATGKRYAP